MSKQPIIGITVDCNEKQTAYESPYAYATSVERAGGLPILLPYRTDLSLVLRYADMIDGIVFTGGNDISPQHYGEQWHPKAIPVDPAREKFEFALIAEIERRRTPMLGICFGSQLLNIHRGGSMYQFLPDLPRDGALEHRRIGDVSPRHDVALVEDSLAAKVIGKTSVSANSSHKQAVKNVGRGLRVIAKSPDGIIEGTEDPAYPLMLGVQWHPERLSDEPEHLALFRLLVSKAGQSKAADERR
jgi:putative glutamine amidotransferase